MAIKEPLNGGTPPRRDDATILDNAPQIITIAGQKFQFCEPGTRKHRRIVAKLADIGQTYGQKFGTALEGVNMDNAEAVTGAYLAAGISAVELADSVDEMLDLIKFALDIEPGCDLSEYVDNHHEVEELWPAIDILNGIIERPSASGVAPTPQPTETALEQTQEVSTPI